MQAASKLHNLFLLLLIIPLSLAEWTVTPGTNCSPGEGGEAIGEDSERTSISLSKCLAACEEDKTCVAIVRRAQDEAGPCYMRLPSLNFTHLIPKKFRFFFGRRPLFNYFPPHPRSNINLVLCVADKELEVHMLNRGQDDD